MIYNTIFTLQPLIQESVLSPLLFASSSFIQEHDQKIFDHYTTLNILQENQTVSSVLESGEENRQHNTTAVSVETQ
jgi:hypothetical protein